jgi:hypothetical protein
MDIHLNEPTVALQDDHLEPPQSMYIYPMDILVNEPTARLPDDHPWPH